MKRKADPVGLSKISSKYDPALGSLLHHYRGNDHYKTLIPDPNMRRVFSVLFDKDDVKNFLDLTAHQPNYVIPSSQLLESHAKQGLLPLISYMLNSK
jgi:hypothetical protein